MALNKIYTRINWVNLPSRNTALDETNLNKMDSAINTLDDRIISLDTTKADSTALNDLVNSWTMDEKTGVITITKVDGTQTIFDLNIEKIPVSFSMDSNGVITMITSDGTKWTANISDMIPILTFNDSDEIAVSVSGSGKNKTYSFSVKNGSITEDKLQPNFLADVRVEVANAKAYSESASSSASDADYDAKLAQSYAVGGSGVRSGENTDNAKYYKEQAESILSTKVDKVEGKGLSTNDYTDEEQTKLAGIDKGANKTTVDTALSGSSTNPVQNKVITNYLNALGFSVANGQLCVTYNT